MRFPIMWRKLWNCFRVNRFIVCSHVSGSSCFIYTRIKLTCFNAMSLMLDQSSMLYLLQNGNNSGNNNPNPNPGSLGCIKMGKEELRAHKSRFTLWVKRFTAKGRFIYKKGKRIVLPSSFTGGPRYMMQLYQDAIAICSRIGVPDPFITFTCNPKWKEITLALSKIPGQRPEDRPDIIARIFKLKLKNLMEVLLTKKHLGILIKYPCIWNPFWESERSWPHPALLFTFQGGAPYPQHS